MYKNILIVGAELQSIGLDMTDRGRAVSVIFGDGAGAAIVSRSEEDGVGVLSTHLHAEGEHAKELAVLAREWVGVGSPIFWPKMTRTMSVIFHT
jgi:3-oxoacyl-[acyl-carrier-protein] synthase-3